MQNPVEMAMMPFSRWMVSVSCASCPSPQFGSRPHPEGVGKKTGNARLIAIANQYFWDAPHQATGETLTLIINDARIDSVEGNTECLNGTYRHEAVADQVFRSRRLVNKLLRAAKTVR
jgi:hypothetical protein